MTVQEIAETLAREVENEKIDLLEAEINDAELYEETKRFFRMPGHPADENIGRERR